MTRDGAPFDEMCEPDLRERLAADPLSQYKKKREFDETPEPEGDGAEGGNKHRFVIQRHKAKKAGEHFDLRLENDEGAMSSWSIPKHKLPSGTEKLLAVKTEDHPLEYRTFKGTIPEGEYGAGEMGIHDSGTYEEIEWGKTKIVFRLKGKKEKGAYKLFRTDGKRWMIMAAKDEDLKQQKADSAPLSIRQLASYTCGPAALRTVLSLLGLETESEKGLKEELGTTKKDGTDPEALMSAGKRRGLSVEMKEASSIQDLRRMADRGPVIVLFQAWPDTPGEKLARSWDDGHYAVVTGIGDKNVRLSDPGSKEPPRSIDIEEFERRWHDKHKGHPYRRLAILFEGSGAPLSSRAMASSWQRGPYWFQPHEEAPLSMREVSYKWQPGMPGTQLVPKTEEEMWKEHLHQTEEKTPLSEKDEPPPSAEPETSQPDDKKRIYLLTFLTKGPGGIPGQGIGWYPDGDSLRKAVFSLIDDFKNAKSDSTLADIVRFRLGWKLPKEQDEKLTQFLTDPDKTHWRSEFAAANLDPRPHLVPAAWKPIEWGSETPRGRHDDEMGYLTWPGNIEQPPGADESWIESALAQYRGEGDEDYGKDAAHSIKQVTDWIQGRGAAHPIKQYHADDGRYWFRPYEEAPLSMREVSYKWRPGMPGTLLEPKSEEEIWRQHQEEKKRQAPQMEEKPPAAEEPAKPLSRRETPSEIDRRFLVSILDHMIGWYPSIAEAEQAIKHLVKDFASAGLNSTVAQIIQHHTGPRRGAAKDMLNEFFTGIMPDERRAVAEALVTGREYHTPKDWAPAQPGSSQPEGFSGATDERMMDELPEQEEWADEIREDLARDLDERGLVIDGLLVWAHSPRSREYPPPVDALERMGKWMREQGYQ